MVVGKMPMEDKGLHNKEERKLWLDVLRVLAACAVVMMHTLTGAVDIMNASAYTNTKQLLIIMDLTTWCVPVFLVISGYLFLDPTRKLGWKIMCEKYCLRIVLALLIFGIPFACLELILLERTFRPGMIWEGFLMVLSMKSWSHLWYLYLILVLYAVTPAIKWLFARLPRKVVIGLELLLFVGSSVLPFGNKLIGGDALIKLPEQGIYLFYYIFGYCMHFGEADRSDQMMEKKKKQDMAAGSAGSLTGQWYLGMVLILLLVMAGYRFMDIKQIQMAYNYPPTVLIALGLMYGGMKIEQEEVRYKKNRKGKMADTITAFSKLGFGVYLLHPIFLNLFYKYLHILPEAGNFSLLLMVLFITSLAGALCMSWGLYKIPFLRKYVL